MIPFWLFKRRVASLRYRDGPVETMNCAFSWFWWIRSGFEFRNRMRWRIHGAKSGSACVRNGHVVHRRTRHRMRWRIRGTNMRSDSVEERLASSPRQVVTGGR